MRVAVGRRSAPTPIRASAAFSLTDASFTSSMQQVRPCLTTADSSELRPSPSCLICLCLAALLSTAFPATPSPEGRLNDDLARLSAQRAE